MVERSLIASGFLTRLKNLALLEADFTRRKWAEEFSENLGLLCVLCHQAHHLIQQQTHILPADTRAETLFVALPVPCLIRHQLGSDFFSPNLTFAQVAGVYSVEHAWSFVSRVNHKFNVPASEVNMEWSFVNKLAGDWFCKDHKLSQPSVIFTSAIKRIQMWFSAFV